MNKKKVFGLAILILLIILGYVYREQVVLIGDQEYIHKVVDDSGPFGPLLFMLIYGAVLLVGLPAIPLTLAGGYIFGFWEGTIYVLCIATLMAAVGFYIPRWLGLSYQTKKGKVRGVQKIVRGIEKQVTNNGFMTILLIRPLFGYMLLSYAAGFVKKLRFKDFIFATIIMNLIFTPVYVLLGERIMGGAKGLLFPLALVIIVFIINIIIKRAGKKKK